MGYYEQIFNIVHDIWKKAYQYYKIAASEDSYRVRSDTVAQNTCYYITGFELINLEYCIDNLDILKFETLFYF